MMKVFAVCILWASKDKAGEVVLKQNILAAVDASNAKDLAKEIGENDGFSHAIDSVVTEIESV